MPMFNSDNLSATDTVRKIQNQFSNARAQLAGLRNAFGAELNAVQLLDLQKRMSRTIKRANRLADQRDAAGKRVHSNAILNAAAANEFVGQYDTQTFMQSAAACRSALRGVLDAIDDIIPKTADLKPDIYVGNTKRWSDGTVSSAGKTDFRDALDAYIATVDAPIDLTIGDAEPE